MRKVMLLLAMAMMSFSQLSAQESAVDDHGIFNHLSVGVGVGLTGISVEAAAPITPYVTVRGGVNIFPQCGHVLVLMISPPFSAIFFAFRFSR